MNDPAGDAATLAHLLNYDSVHGRWAHDAASARDTMIVGDRIVHCTANKAIADTDWSDCDVVIEASGKFKSQKVLQAFLDQGVKRVVVTAPIKEAGVLESSPNTFVKVKLRKAKRKPVFFYVYKGALCRASFR